jgi:hypothetical protein
MVLLFFFFRLRSRHIEGAITEKVFQLMRYTPYIPRAAHQDLTGPVARVTYPSFFFCVGILLSLCFLLLQVRSDRHGRWQLVHPYFTLTNCIALVILLGSSLV